MFLINRLTLIILLFSSLILASCVLPLKQSGWEQDQDLSQDQQSAKQTFTAYKYALLNNLGKDASDLISEKTIQHYAHLRSLALAGTPEEINALSAYNKLVVLNMRHTISGHLLQQMSAKDIFAYGVEQEWISKESVAPYELGNISVYGAYASAELLRGETPINTRIEFLNENSVWRINLMPILKKTSQSFTAQISGNEQKTENRIIFNLIESMSGRKVSDTIWQPVLSAKPLLSNQSLPNKTIEDKK